MLNIEDSLDKKGLAKSVRVGYQEDAMVDYHTKQVDNGDYVIIRTSVAGVEKVLTTAYTKEGVSDLLYKFAFRFVGSNNNFSYHRNGKKEGQEIKPDFEKFKQHLETCKRLEAELKKGNVVMKELRRQVVMKELRRQPKRSS